MSFYFSTLAPMASAVALILPRKSTIYILYGRSAWYSCSPSPPEHLWLVRLTTFRELPYPDRQNIKAPDCSEARLLYAVFYSFMITGFLDKFP